MLYGVLRTPLSEEGSWTLLRPLFPLCLFEGWGRGWLTFLHWGSRSQVWPSGQRLGQRGWGVCLFSIPLDFFLWTLSFLPQYPHQHHFFPRHRKVQKPEWSKKKREGKSRGRWEGGAPRSQGEAYLMSKVSASDLCKKGSGSKSGVPSTF